MRKPEGTFHSKSRPEMLKRYPHSAQVLVETTTVDANHSGITGPNVANSSTIDIRGRFEEKSGNAENYNAKFYTRQDRRLKYLEQDKHKLKFSNRIYDIHRIIPMETHTEIWLK